MKPVRFRIFGELVSYRKTILAGFFSFLFFSGYGRGVRSSVGFVKHGGLFDECLCQKMRV